MQRIPLRRGTSVAIDGKSYVIGDVIGEGGFSYIYATEPGSGTDVVIKEYYPASGALRDERTQRVFPAPGQETVFQQNLAQFAREGYAGVTAARESFQTVAFLAQEGGYAVLPRWSRDMCAVSALVRRWKEEPPAPYSGREEDRDPCFPDLPRVQYALRVTESVLAALGAVHAGGLLHLDISGGNVVWAGQEPRTGRGCAAFLTDFGSAAEVSGGVRAAALLSYSPGFAAPELRTPGAALTAATDLYSVGMLLFYLCAGEGALQLTRFPKKTIRRELGRLRVQGGARDALEAILLRTAAPQSERYQTAGQMQADVRALLERLPRRPVNPTPARDFTLASLRSLLEGSETEGYGWAEELRDRRGTSIELPPDTERGVSGRMFADGGAFLRFVLPEELYACLRALMKGSPVTERDILGGWIDRGWKRALAARCRDGGTRRLLQIARTLLEDETRFFADMEVLFALLGEDGAYLHACMQRCPVQQAPYTALAALILFALLGPEELRRLVDSPREAARYFYII